MRILAFASCLCLAAGVGQAAPTRGLNGDNVPSAVRDERLDAARELIDGMDIERQMMAAGLMSADTTMQAQFDLFRKEGMEVPAELVDKVRSLTLEETRAMLEEMKVTVKEDAARIYASHFSAEELRQLKELQAQPIMRKAQALSPQLSVELSKLGADKAAERSAELTRKITALVKGWVAERTARTPTS